MSAFAIHYRAVIIEPAPQLKPDKYGTVTMPAVKQITGPNLHVLRSWAREELPKCPKGSYCEIRRIEDEVIERIDQLVAK